MMMVDDDCGWWWIMMMEDDDEWWWWWMMMMMNDDGEWWWWWWWWTLLLLMWHVTWSFHFIFFPTIMLQWWGSDRTVQSQRCLPSSHCCLTSLPFHYDHLTLPYNYPLILPDGLTENVLRWCCQLYGKTTSTLQWKSSQCSKAGLWTWRWKYEWWWWHCHNLWICQFLLFTVRCSSAFIQCERGITGSNQLMMEWGDGRGNFFKEK